MATNGTLKYRITKAEEKIKMHDKVLFGEHGVLTNHIPTIEKNMAAIKTEVRILAIINIGTLILFKLLN